MYNTIRAHLCIPDTGTTVRRRWRTVPLLIGRRCVRVIRRHWCHERLLALIRVHAHAAVTGSPRGRHAREGRPALCAGPGSGATGCGGSFGASAHATTTAGARNAAEDGDEENDANGDANADDDALVFADPVANFLAHIGANTTSLRNIRNGDELQSRYANLHCCICRHLRTPCRRGSSAAGCSRRWSQTAGLHS